MDFKQRVQLGNDSSLLVWYPKLQKLPIPQIRTEIVKTGYEPLSQFVRKDKPMSEDLWLKLYHAMDMIGAYPMFMRSDQASGKHNWKRTCYIESKNDLKQHLYDLIEEHEMQNMGGELGYEAIVFREFLDLETGFKCFYGDFPVNKEVRCFIKNRKVQSLRHYWVKQAVAEGDPQDKNWESKLEKLKTYSKRDIEEIKEQLSEVCKVFSEYWSVDFAKSKEGIWYLIDMARGEVSYQSEEIIWENTHQSNGSGGTK